MKTQFEKIVLIVLFWALIISIPRVESQENKSIVSTIIGKNGQNIDKIIITGRPPKLFKPASVEMPALRRTATVNYLSYVPAYFWSYGCSATSGAIVAGYYDNSGYIGVYTGPSFGGVMPKNNSTWGTTTWPDFVDGGTITVGECPLSATRNGIDGRITRGHVDDYWIGVGHAGPDPYITNGWTEHTHSECTGDFMKTNQSTHSNSDGSTAFYYWPNGSPLDDSDMISEGVADRDGCHGLRLFFESRGYTILQNYNQYIDTEGITYGFTFAQYKQEIDSGRPVLIHVTNHTMVGVGYDDTGNTIYLRNTWDYGIHSMTWGGSYSGLNHYGVSVIELQSVTDISTPSIPGTPSDAGIWSSSPNITFTWTSATDVESDVIDYQLQVGTTPGAN